MLNGAIREYELNWQQLKKAETSYRKYENTRIIDTYNKLCMKRDGKLPNKTVHYAAGALELTPAEAKDALTAMQVLKGSYNKNSNMQKRYTVYNVSQLVIDNIRRDPELTEEQKNEKICELELTEYERVSKNVEEANRIQNTDRYRISRENEDSRNIG